MSGKNLRRPRPKVQNETTPAPRLASALLNWFHLNARDLPWRRTSDPYAIWVSEIMLQQTQVKTVIPYWERWMHTLPTIQSLAAASPNTIHKLWEGLGYYTRVRNMQKAAQQILALHDGTFPRDYDAILALPGIGRYTAGAIASIAFNQPRPILDGNVIRVLTRVFGITGNPREKSVNQHLWTLAEQLVTAAASEVGHALRCAPSRTNHPLDASSLVATTKRTSQQAQTADLCSLSLEGPRFAKRSSPVGKPSRGGLGKPLGQGEGEFFRSCSHLNQSLMELGALICTPKQPQCPICPLRQTCVALRTRKISQLPNLGPCASATTRRFFAFVIHRNGRYLVRQRPSGVVNAHLWEFPNIESPAAGNGTANLRALARTALNVRPRTLEKLCSIKHTITRYRITMDVYQAVLSPAARGPARPTQLQGTWFTPAQLAKLAFPSAHRKILRSIES